MGEPSDRGVPRVLWVGSYRDGTGYGQASIDYILALDAAGVPVVPRPLKLNDRAHRPPDRVLELEAAPAGGCDVVVQHTLPHLMAPDGHFRKNVGLFAWETTGFGNSCWPSRLALMDEVWAVSEAQREACVASGVRRPVRAAPHCTDMGRFQRSHARLPWVPQGFVFYTVGEFVRRKNLGALLRAYFLEFGPADGVHLVVKADRPGQSPADCRRDLEAFCDEISRGLRLGSRRPPVTLVTERLTDEEVLRLHASCDCFVQASFGEAWGQPAFDAMAMGKTPVVTGWGGYLDYLGHAEGWLVDYRLEPVFGSDCPFQDLYTGRELWASVDVLDLMRCMRQAYADRGKRERKALAGIRRAYDFSHEAVGARLKGFLTA